MKKKGHRPGPVPRGNRTTVGPDALPRPTEDRESKTDAGGGAAFAEQGPKRRLGHFQTEGEAAMIEPGGRHGTRPDV
jgi:hypothetical protein